MVKKSLLLFLVPLFLVASCINQSHPKVTFESVKDSVMLLGDTIHLYDQKMNIIGDLSDLSGRMVQMQGVSEDFYNKEDYCQAFKYVKIKYGDKEGIVNGKKVFVYSETENQRDTTIITGDTSVRLVAMHTVRLGVHEEFLMFCTEKNPVLIIDQAKAYCGLIKIETNQYHKEAIMDSEYPFFQLISNSGLGDEIHDLEIVDNHTIKLKIHRGFQEGDNFYDVLLKYNGECYTARYLNYGKINYPY